MSAGYTITTKGKRHEPANKRGSVFGTHNSEFVQVAHLPDLHFRTPHFLTRPPEGNLFFALSESFFETGGEDAGGRHSGTDRVEISRRY